MTLVCIEEPLDTASALNQLKTNDTLSSEVSYSLLRITVAVNGTKADEVLDFAHNIYTYP